MPFNNSSHFVISQATLSETNIVNNGSVGEATYNETNIINNNGISDTHFLYQHAARGASYNSKDKFDKPKCDPNTRVQLLSDIHEWIKVPEKETGIMFLHGPAGAGKSCIARSACEEAAQKGLLGASFFFWRGSSARNNESRLITTLAYQLSQGSEELRRYILSEIAQNPHVVEMGPEVQFRKLIIEPCMKVPRERLSARVIVIDGLDECIGEETQIGILHMLAKAVRHEGFPLAFFVTSRPELHIQEALDSKELIFDTNVVSLNQVPGVLQDIQTVLESGFIRILNNPRFKRAFKSVPRPWPTSDSIDQLVRRSSGQFIYVATVLKYVSNSDSNPASLLKIVLGIKEYDGSLSQSPFANLDLLYHQIMSRVKYPELTAKVLSYVFAIKDLARREIIKKGIYGKKLIFSPDITRAVLYNQNRLLLVIEQLLGLSEGAAYSALNQLHSLVSLKVGSESTRRHLEIDFYHKSFQDYLTTEERSTTFYVDLKKAHQELAQSCLKFMGLQRYETESQHVGWLYSCFQWSVHRKFWGRKLCISSYDTTLKRFSSGLTGYLNVPNLNKALQVLGLSGGPWTVFSVGIQKFALLPLESIVHALKDARLTMQHSMAKADLTTFNKLYFYSVSRKLLQSYNDTRSLKLFLCIHYTRVFDGKVSEHEASNFNLVSEKLGLISDGAERISVVSQYNDIVQQVDSLMDWSDLKKFIFDAERSEELHCTSEVISDVYATIISTGVWRNNMWNVCFNGGAGVEFTASSSLLSCLKSEAFEFHDNLELNRTLDYFTESNLFRWLRQKIQGPKEGVIEAWERTFDKARGLFPDKFKDSRGEIIPRE